MFDMERYGTVAVFKPHSKDYIRDAVEIAEPLFSGQDYDHIIFDLEEVEFMDSKAISYVLSCCKDAQRNNKKFGLARVESTVQSVLDHLNISSVVTSYDNSTLDKILSSGQSL